MGRSPTSHSDSVWLNAPVADKSGNTVGGTSTVIAIAAVYAVSGTVFFIRLFGDGLPFRYEFGGALALAALVAVAPSLALSARRGATSLLVPASTIAFMSAAVTSVFAPVVWIAAVIWLLAWVRADKPQGLVGTALTTLVVSALWVAAAITFFVHIDPLCVQLMGDGTTRIVATPEWYSGWIWGQPRSSTGASIVSADVLQTFCTSDTVTAIETIVTVGLSIGAVGGGVRLASRSHRVRV